MAAQLRGKLLHEVAHLTTVIIIVELAAAIPPSIFPKPNKERVLSCCLGKGSAYKIFCIEVPQNLKILLLTTWLQSVSES